MILTVIMQGIPKATAELSVLMEVYTDRGYINLMCVLQSSTDSLHILPGASSDTCAVSSDCAYHVGNMEVEVDLDMHVEEEEEVKVKVKTEKGIVIEEEEGIYREEEVEKEDIDIKEEENAGIKEEVSLEGTV